MQLDASAWPATRAEALRRLADFLPRAGRAYAAQRNYDRSPDDRRNVSVLSPYLRRRMVTEAEIVAAVIDRHGLSSAEKFVQEVLWRSYWKGWLEARPSVWTRYRADLAAMPPEGEVYHRAIVGQIGNAAFDAWIAELIRTGYLHNHARMWVASIWIFTLGLPWQWGAEFFLRHLLDGDAASNTLSWRWVAGLQTRGKTYLARRDNILTYTDGRLDPGPDLATIATPLPLDDVGPAGRLVPPPLPPGHARAVLLLHDDDLGLETLDLGGLEIAATTALVRPIDDVAPAVRRFAQAAAADALTRAIHPTALLPDDDAAAARALIDHARAVGARVIALPSAPVGPTQSALQAIGPALTAAGLGVIELRRDWDRAAWPHAARGFFQFREHIPEILERVGISLR